MPNSGESCGKEIVALNDENQGLSNRVTGGTGKSNGKQHGN